MRRCWFAMILLTLSSPAAPAETAPPAAKPGDVPTSSEKSAFVPTGVERDVNFIEVLRPDCSSLGTIYSRVLVKPEHGDVAFEEGTEFGSYPMGNPREHCNGQKTSGLFTRYKSQDGYTGQDYFEILYLLPPSSATIVKYTAVVK